MKCHKDRAGTIPTAWLLSRAAPDGREITGGMWKGSVCIPVPAENPLKPLLLYH